MIQNKITLQGFPFDEKSSYLKGSAQAPPLIRLAYNSPSASYFAENGLEIQPELLDDKGDFEIEEYMDIAEITLDNITKDRPLITLGGDHSISYPVISAFNKVYGKLEILHIDAHPDLYDSFEGDPHSHACPFARIMENGLASRLTQIGIRTLNTHQREQAEKYGVYMIEMKDLDSKSLPAFEAPLYLSLDLDALDPAYAPGVSHHEPGGLSTRQVLEILNKIQIPIVGADIVEYNPQRDIHGVTAMIASKFLKEIASKML
ncbi:agmatinase family protein [Poritiphilus flavus]|uniref:Agmatinase n=1 Tax=Poritiphilus flavus TaxID=2697053 RepID=A0A6L9EFS1_9FLAO|nr:agmatinase family protein [Poritiphilus flavus]NAS13531.1 agmatinase [Poritiphilus flavus]